MNRFLENKWMRAAIPALLIHCSIGTVYCWSTVKDAVAEAIGAGTFTTGWAFSLAIFFLGMSAAFMGGFVERNVHLSALVACLFFSTGMFASGLVTLFAKGAAGVWLLYLCYGAIMGIGLGVGYLTPVKTLMLWFPDQKGLATGISIMGFGLAKAIATPIMERLQATVGISNMFFILGGAYFCIMYLGYLLLKKPDSWNEPAKKENRFNRTAILKNSNFIRIWLMFYLNIHCGLMLISYEKQALAAVAASVVVIPSITAAANALGRIGYSTASDRMKDRATAYRIIFISSVIFSACAAATGLQATVVAAMIVINLGYGGGFSTLPALLESRFGLKDISKIHGLALTAWAVAGISGNNLSAFILNRNGGDHITLFAVAAALYALALFIGIGLEKPQDKTA